MTAQTDEMYASAFEEFLPKMIGCLLRVPCLALSRLSAMCMSRQSQDQSIGYIYIDDSMRERERISDVDCVCKVIALTITRTTSDNKGRFEHGWRITSQTDAIAMSRDFYISFYCESR